MDINKGLNKDVRPISLPSGTWIDAKNIIRLSGNGIQNMKGFDISEEIDGNIIGIIEIDKDPVLFIYDIGSEPKDAKFTIAQYTGTNVLNVVCSMENQELLNNFNINDTSRITGEFVRNYNNELIISFHDWVNKSKPLLLNLDNLPFNTDTEGYILPNPYTTLERTYELMLLQPEFKTPFFNVETTISGGNLKCGVYQFCIQYELRDYDYTNKSIISEPYFIGDHTYKSLSPDVFPDKWGDTYDVYKGTGVDICLSSNYGQVVGKTMKVNIDNLDQTFNRFKLIALYRNGEVSEAYNIGVFDITEKSKVVYFSGQYLTTESYELYSVPSAMFDGVNALTKFQDRLSLLGVNYNDDEIWTDEANGQTYQVYANNIKLNVLLETIPSGYKDRKITTTFDDASKIYKGSDTKYIKKYSTFMPGEAYSFYVGFTKGGKVSKAYHIPGRNAREITKLVPEIGGTSTVQINLFENDVINDHDPPILTYEELTLDDNIKYFEMFDTAIYGDELELGFGYWENENELYPDTINSKVYGPTDTILDDLAGWKVRHHKMPSVSEIAKLYGSNIDVAIQVTFDFDSVHIPSAVSDNYDAIVLLYAEKTFQESIILGHSPILSNRALYSRKMRDDFEPISNENNIRFYDYGLNAITPAISPTHISGEVGLKHIGVPFSEDVQIGLNTVKHRTYDVVHNTTIVQEYDFGSDRTRLVDGYNYMSEGDSSADPPNILTSIETEDVIINRESILSINSPGQLFITDVDDIEGSLRHYKGSSGGYAYPDGVFVFEMNNETLHSYGQHVILGSLKSFKHNVHVKFNKQNLIMSNCVSSRQSGGVNLDIAYGVKLSDIINQTVDLSNVKYSGDCVHQHELFRFKANIYEPVAGTNPYSVTEMTLSMQYPTFSRVNNSFRKDINSLYETQTYDYNTIFSIRNTSNYIVPSNIEDKNVTQIDTRFTRSYAFGSESKEIGWRQFDLTDYYDFPKDAGQGSYLLGRDLDIIFGFTNSMYLGRIRETLQTAETQLSLKTNELFDTNPSRMTDSFDRNIHLLSNDYIFVTKDGLFIYDVHNEEFYIFTGEAKPQAIGKLGLDNFLKSIDITRIQGGYDKETDHTFVSIKTNTNDYTFSFYLRDKQFVSEYDFYLDYYFTRYEELKGILNETNTFRIKSFNDGDYGVYDLNEDLIPIIKDSYIDLVYTDANKLSKFIKSIMFNTEIVDGNTVLWDKTIKGIAVYTDYQCFYDVAIASSKLHFSHGTYSFNEIVDLVIDPKQPIIIDGVIQTDNVNNTKNWFDKSNIISKFVVIRLILGNSSNYKSILNNLVVNTEKSI